MPEVESVVVSICRIPGTDGEPLPSYQTAAAAGMDVCAAVTDPVSIPPGQWRAIPTGLTIALPPGYEAQIRPRSGLARNFGIGLVNSPGTIDADYRGEIQVLLINHGSSDFMVQSGDRIAQMVVAPITRVIWNEVAVLETTDRGAGGFGHTGTR